MFDRRIREPVLSWRKSGASTDEDDCVEIATAGDAVFVRDSKAPEAGMLSIDPSQWRAVLRHIAMDGVT